VVTHFAGVYKQHMADLRRTIAELRPEATVFSNGTTAIRAENQRHALHTYNTHQDLEDLLPLYNVPVALRVPEEIKKATLIPGNEELPLEQDGDTVKVLVPQFQMHCAVVFAY